MEEINKDYVKKVLTDVQAALGSTSGQQRYLLQANLKVLTMALGNLMQTLDADITRELFAKSGYSIDDSGKITVPGFNDDTPSMDLASQKSEAAA